jgi:putative endonuclease
LKAYRIVGLLHLNMFYTYILYSEKIDRYYIGYSENPEQRLDERHNAGSVKSTKAGAPYKLMAKKPFHRELEARAEELRLKRKKSRKYLEWLIDGNW